jgi:hypothetical protein
MVCLGGGGGGVVLILVFIFAVINDLGPLFLLLDITLDDMERTFLLQLMSLASSADDFLWWEEREREQESR